MVLAPDPTWMVETSVLVDLVRGRPAAEQWLAAHRGQGLAVSAVSYAELLAGCRDRAEENRIHKQMKQFDVRWIDVSASRLALELYAKLRLSHGVSFFDCLIAGQAVTLGLRLATLNSKHFGPVVDLDSLTPY